MARIACAHTGAEVEALREALRVERAHAEAMQEARSMVRRQETCTHTVQPFLLKPGRSDDELVTSVASKKGLLSFVKPIQMGMGMANVALVLVY